MVATAEEIIRKAQNCLKQKKNINSALIGLGIAHFEKGDFDKAIEFYQKALQEDPDSAEANAGMGMALARINKTNESIESFKKALKMAPGCGILANWIADAYFDLGDLENAIEFYGQATRLNRMDSNAHNDLADAYRLSGQIDLAIEHYDLTIQLDPFDTNAILEKAQCLLLKNRKDEACKALIDLIEKFPKTRDAGTATILAGNIFSGKKDFKTAIGYFQKALDFFPYNTNVLFQTGLAYMVNGDKTEAEKCFKKIVELDPSDEKVKKLLQELRK